ncbi:hypothetical protein K3X41_01315 [Aliiroseovarius crassostreae]|nr:hypothetical protein [Aliiroseovarius crassostreae]UWQ11372.1 hypothetical protein K3X41_01315 [Aliiroseovarius crassostreae]
MAVLTAPVGLVAVAFATVGTTIFGAAKKFLASEPTPTWTEYMHKCNCEK